MTLYPSTTQSKKFRNLILRNALMGIAVAMIIGVSIIAIAPGYAYDVLRVEDYEPVTGSPGVILAQVPATSFEIVDLLRTSSFTLESGWQFDEYGYPSTQLTYTNTTEGVQVSGNGLEFRMYRNLNILIDDFDSVNFSFSVRSVSGSMSCGIGVAFDDAWPTTPSIGYFTDTVEWEEGQEGTVSYEAPMSLLRSRTMHWILPVRFEIHVKFPSVGSAFIYDARVQAVSASSVVPVVIDVRDLDNESLLGRTESRCITSPYINVTSSPYSQCSYIMLNNANETVFLPAGNYSMDYGWYGWNVREEFHKRGSFLLNIALNSEVFVIVKMSVVRLYVESNIGAYLWIEFSDGPSWDSKYLGRWAFFTTRSSYVYFPTELGPLFVEIWMDAFRFQTNFTIGMNHLRLHVTLPIFNFVGLGLDAVQLFIFLILAGLIIASVISLTGTAASLPLGKALRKTRGLPIFLFVLSYLVPWVVYLNPAFTYAGLILQIRTLCVPTGFETNSYLFGITFIQYPVWGYGALLMMSFQIVFFWLPLFYLIRQSLYDSPLRMDIRTLLPPAIPGVFGLLILIYPVADAYAGPGAVLAFAAFMIIALRVTHKWWLKKKKDRVKANEPE